MSTLQPYSDKHGPKQGGAGQPKFLLILVYIKLYHRR
jgi:hypothetical protein